MFENIIARKKLESSIKLSKLPVTKDLDDVARSIDQRSGYREFNKAFQCGHGFFSVRVVSSAGSESLKALTTLMTPFVDTKKLEDLAIGHYLALRGSDTDFITMKWFPRFEGRKQWLSERRERLQNMICSIREQWRIEIAPIPPQDVFVGDHKAFGYESRGQMPSREDMQEVVVPFIQRKLASRASKAASVVNSYFLPFMDIELPKLEKLDQILEALIRVEAAYQEQTNTLTDQYERSQEVALEQQRNEYDSKLEELRAEYQEQLVETQKDLAQMHKLVDGIFGQNSDLIDAMKSQSGDYEGRMLALLRTLKNEL